MTADFNLVPCSENYSGAVNDEGAPVNTQILASVEFFWYPYAKSFNGEGFRVGKQRDGQFPFLDELFVAFHAVLTDAIDGYSKLSELRQRLGELLCFQRTAGGVVLWIKVEYGKLCGCVRHADFTAGCIRETERRDGVVYAY